MKKLVATILMVTYMAGAIGLTFSLHYCGGHFKEVCFTADTEKNCCGNNHKNHHCCEDKVMNAKFKDHHTASAKAFLSKIFIQCNALRPAETKPSIRLPENGYCSNITCGHSPPGSSPVPVYLLNCVLRV